MKKILFALLSIGSLATQAQGVGDLWNKAKEEVKKDPTKVTEEIKKATEAVKGNGGPKIPTNEEIIAGLKEALNTGTNNSTGTVSKVDGYLKNPRLVNPFRPEPEKMKKKPGKTGNEKKGNEI